METRSGARGHENQKTRLTQRRPEAPYTGPAPQTPMPHAPGASASNLQFSHFALASYVFTLLTLSPTQLLGALRHPPAMFHVEPTAERVAPPCLPQFVEINTLCHPQVPQVIEVQAVRAPIRCEDARWLGRISHRRVKVKDT